MQIVKIIDSAEQFKNIATDINGVIKNQQQQILTEKDKILLLAK